MKISLALFVLFFVFTLPACKKDSGSNTLCTGNGTNSYFPLAVGDNRQFIVNNSVQTSTVITGQSGSYFYEEIIGSGPAFYDTLMVAANGDVYDKNPYYATQFLLVPGSAQTGQTWSYSDTLGKTYYQKIISVQASTLTSSCLYNNCLEIQDSLNSNNVKITFYAPGVGPVQSMVTVGAASTSELTGLILK